MIFHFELNFFELNWMEEGRGMMEVKSMLFTSSLQLQTPNLKE